MSDFTVILQQLLPLDSIQPPGVSPDKLADHSCIKLEESGDVVAFVWAYVIYLTDFRGSIIFDRTWASANYTYRREVLNTDIGQGAWNGGGDPFHSSSYMCYSKAESNAYRTHWALYALDSALDVTSLESVERATNGTFL